MLDDRNMDIHRRENLRSFVVLGTILEGLGKRRAKPARIPDLLTETQKGNRISYNLVTTLRFSVFTATTFDFAYSVFWQTWRNLLNTEAFNNYCVGWWWNFAVGSSRNVTIDPFLKCVPIIFNINYLLVCVRVDG